MHSPHFCALLGVPYVSMHDVILCNLDIARNPNSNRNAPRLWVVSSSCSTPEYIFGARPSTSRRMLKASCSKGAVQHRIPRRAARCAPPAAPRSLSGSCKRPRRPRTTSAIVSGPPSDSPVSAEHLRRSGRDVPFVFMASSEQ